MTQNFQDNSLTISGTIARDSGTYTCVVSNGLDNATAGAILTVKGNRCTENKYKDTVNILHLVMYSL